MVDQYESRRAPSLALCENFRLRMELLQVHRLVDVWDTPPKVDTEVSRLRQSLVAEMRNTLGKRYPKWLAKPLDQSQLSLLPKGWDWDGHVAHNRVASVWADEDTLTISHHSGRINEDGDTILGTSVSVDVSVVRAVLEAWWRALEDHK